MKKLVAMVLILAFALPSFAIVEDDQVQYIGGTVPGLKNETMGTFDTTQEEALVFHSPQQNVTIPYAKITKFNYEERVAHHMGVLLTLAVVMLKYRQRRHFLHVSYVDDRGVTQIATFEVAKERPITLVPIIQSRISKCKPGDPAKRESLAQQPVPAPAAAVAAK